MAKKGCRHGRRKNGRCPAKGSGAKRRGRKARAKKCAKGVNKNTGACLKNKRAKKR